jgi:signal peptidase
MTRAARFIAKAVSALTFLAVLAAIALTMALPRAFHAAVLTVETGSMTPGIPVGSLVIVRPVDPQTLHEGDVITFQKAPGEHVLVTHRIVKVQVDASNKHGLQFVTKGDANRGADAEPVPAAAVKGKVWYHLPYIGTFKNIAGNSSVAMLAVLVGLGAYALVQVASALLDRRRPKTPAEAAKSASTDAAPATTPGRRLQLLAATLQLSEFAGLSAQDATQLLRAELVGEGPETFTISLAREPEVLDAFVERLRPFSPVHLVRSEIVVVPPHTPPVPAAGADTLESGRPSHVTA